MTVFAKIIAGQLPAVKFFENEHLIVIEDIHKIAPVHLLIIPKKAYKGLQDVPDNELGILKEIGKAAQLMADHFELEDGYRLLTNNGEDAGQTIFHMHFHLLGGRRLTTLG
jgi:histidine triad (HIT) family protein